ncbi:MAG: trigger factor [Actinomycetes bacterium]
MKSTVESLSPTRVKLTVEVPFDELKPSLDQAYRRIGAQVTVPGFRKGKVPARVIDQRVGRGAVLEEAVNEALPKAYSQAVEENSVKVIGQPQVDVTSFDDGTDLTFTAEVDVRPDIELPAFDTISVTVPDAVVSDADVDEQVESLRARFATLKTVERAAADGDFVQIDLVSTHDDEPVEALSATGMSYEVGSGTLLDNLDVTVLGLSAGDSGAFTTTPEAGELEGEAVDVTVTVTAVRERELPAVDNDFAQTVSEFDTLDELKDAVREELNPRKQVEQLMAARDAVLDALVASVDVPLPENVTAQAVEAHFEDGHGDEAHRDEYVQQVRDALKKDLVLDAVADADETQVTQAELAEYIVRQSSQYGMTPDQFAQALSQSGQVGSVFADVRRAKALSVVLEAATVVDASGNPVDLSPAAETDEAPAVVDAEEAPAS